MNDHVTILDPAAPVAEQHRAQVQALDHLRGKVVGFVDNAKPNFNHLVDDIGELLISRHGVAGVVKHRKRAASIPVGPEIMQNLAEQCDLVIAGSGD